MTRTLFVGTVILGLAAGCGKSPEQKAAEQTQQAAQQAAAGAAQAAQGAQTAAQSAQQGVAQMMQGLGQMMQGQQANGQAVQVVDYEKLKELLPDVPGWEKTGAKGSQTSMGVSVSTAEAHYKKGDAEVKLEITDTSLSQMLVAPFMMFGANYSERSDDGYKKGINLNGYTGFEEWEKNSKHAEDHLLVANRFIVHAEASNVDSADPARALVQAVNLQKLASLK
jgi:hypothetical protein